ncbi:MAG: bi-domain-containing oxidoreductase [Acidobacteria bacterium]|nr:bi-domain-containing oxidoreductase [Acidobacteriota bacterium]
MKQVLLREGKVEVADVPAPALSPGRALVATAVSVISAGTESAALNTSRRGALERAVAHPSPLKRLLEVVSEEGAGGILRRLSPSSDELDLMEVGYSAAGVVMARGEGMSVDVGARVACAGSQFAHHAEVLSVPEHLLTTIPEGVTFEQAAFATLGAIALHGFRRSDAALGETIGIVGLGLVGLLGAQIARSAGCKVLAFDPDPSRVDLARVLGIEGARQLGESDPLEVTLASTFGQGADAVLIFAATPSDEPLALAMRLARKKGKVVVVGDVGMGVDRSLMYGKELDLRISTSYGPGRYDAAYEEGGVDYPYAYVRWTEGRNLSAFLDLVAAGQVRVDPLIEHVYPVHQAQAAYASLATAQRKPAVLLSFPFSLQEATQRLSQTVRLERPRESTSGRKAVLVGPGSFMKEVFLPEFVRGKVAVLEAVVSGGGASALAAARRFGAPVASTDLDEVLADTSVSLVLIGTRHHLHASQVERALKAGKSVFVEKPLCLTREELDRIREARRLGGGLLAVGFNRRYAPLVREMKLRLSQLPGPRVIQARVNAGRLPAEHWTQDPKVGGGRLLGEGCHFLDLVPFLAGSPIVSLRVERVPASQGMPPLPDNFALSLRLSDGSLGSILYTSLGDASLGKELLEAHASGASMVLDDFRQLRIHRSGKLQNITREKDKGIAQEVKELKAALAGEDSQLITWKEIESATEWTLRAQELLEGQA